MKLPELSITRAKQLDVVGGALILCFLLLGKWPFEKPTWLRVAALRVAVVVIIGTLLVAFLPREKMDERAVKNERQANSIICNLLYVLAGVVLACTVFAGDFAIASYDLALGFVLLWLGRSSLFLALERFGG